ncbi:hypothetical protein X777_08539 [Ooceraea biroi]|uniref:Reverse transcriptase domain-containing protein n=1 Tax=Ooceraea biroi TaxID=2015173 RepID=A0A026W9L8_OOCBI|nr:hypothetical protein X777_08539 [Ooceraea biroi]
MSGGGKLRRQGLDLSCSTIERRKSNRFILNLKQLNLFVEIEHFKLEDLRTACRLLEPNMLMATIDLKDAYFLIPIKRAALAIISTEDIGANELDKKFFKGLSQKLALLLALGTTHRLQTLALMKISNITSSDKGLEVRIPDRIKSLGTSTRRPLLKLAFNEKPGLCIARTLRYYIETMQRPSSLRSERFTAHSTRHASTSKTFEKGVNIEEIK